MDKTITVETEIKKGMEEVWKFWNEPEHIRGWLFASDDWECPRAENDLRIGGKLNCNMAAKDGSNSFDFIATYTDIRPHEFIAYTMDDGRKVSISFERKNDGVHIIETFEPENENSLEKQREGWQAILDNFKKYCERG